MLDETGLEFSHAAETGDIGMGMGSLDRDIEELSSQDIGGAIKTT